MDVAIRLRPEAASYGDRGHCWLVKGDVVKAIADYDEALRLNPNNAKMRQQRGVAMERAGRYDDAIADQTEAIRLDPKLAAAYSQRGACAMGKSEFGNAIADCNAALGLDGDDLDALPSAGQLLATPPRP